MKFLDKTLKCSGVEMSKNWNSFFFILSGLGLLHLSETSGKRRLGWTEDRFVYSDFYRMIS